MIDIGTGDEDVDETIDGDTEVSWTDDVDEHEENGTGDWDGECSGVSDKDDTHDRVFEDLRLDFDVTSL